MKNHFEIMKNRLHNGEAFSLNAAMERIDDLTDNLQITRAEAAELAAIAMEKASAPGYDERLTAIEQQLEPLAAIGIRTERTQGDKLGYDLIRYYVGDVLAKSEYAQQDNPMGTADNPIPYTDTVPLIPNAYYTLDGVRKVWTGEAASGASWDDPAWEPF